MIFRMEKTTKGNDDYKVLLVGSIIAIFILIVPDIKTRLEEVRWYRDALHLTPFYNVELHYSYVRKRTIILGGSLTKRRCDYKALVGYVISDLGYKKRISVNTSVEDLSGEVGNRPPSSNPELWGPWSLTTPTNFLEKPVSFQIYAEHVKCPSEPIIQRNLFIKGLWLNYDKKVNTK